VTTDGNRAFVATLEQRYGPQLRRYLAARLRHAGADVPDLMQEIFLRLLRIKHHESIRNPQAYLYTVAAHTLHQYTLRRAVTPESVDPLDLVAGLEAQDADPAQQAELEQRFEELGRGLEAFSPRAYVTLLMYRYEGATLEQIGARLGVTRVMAKKYLTKAIVYCQQSLAERE